ncbi:exonuclease SbcCD subunit D [Anaerobacillus sp. MEB173]|uniref:metallophosphoesterase family protein n=1 Tax=Anaerobacillus sp. MEB173 TaxID=3383345 RepID=UPI003F91B7A6
MEQIRFIHTADLHLDSPFKGLNQLPAKILKRVQESTFVALQKLVDLAIDENIDFLLIAGDLYDGEDRSLRAQSRFKKEMERLQEHNIQVYIIHGNHDHLSGKWAKLQWPDNVHFFGENVEGIPFRKNGEIIAYIYGFSYPKQAVYEQMITQYEKHKEDVYHIGLLHGQIEGNQDHDPYAPFSLKDLIDKGFDYWALGHIHKYQQLYDEPLVIYPGNIQGRHIKETGEKGCVLIQLDQDSAKSTFHCTSDIIWNEVLLSIDGVTTVQQLISKCEDVIESYRNNGQGVFLRLIFEGSGPLHSYLMDQERLQELLLTVTDEEENEQDFVWIISHRVHTTASWNRQNLREEEHLVGDIVRLVDEKEEEFVQGAISELYSHHRTRRYLEQLSEEDYQAILREAEALLLTDLLRERVE